MPARRTAAALAIAAAPVLALSACADTIEDPAGVRPGYNYEPQLGVPMPSPDPDDPDRASNAPAQDWSGIEGPRNPPLPAQ